MTADSGDAEGDSAAARGAESLGRVRRRQSLSTADSRIGCRQRRPAAREETRLLLGESLLRSREGARPKQTDRPRRHLSNRTGFGSVTFLNYNMF